MVKPRVIQNDNVQVGIAQPLKISGTTHLPVPKMVDFFFSNLIIDLAILLDMHS
jgi:hypothetical protein